MKSLRQNIEDWLTAMTFAEEGEHDTALRLMGRQAARKKTFALDDLMTAITFGEAGLADTAREFLQASGRKAKAARLELPGVKVWIGWIPVEDAPLAGVKVWSGVVPVNA